MRTIRNALIVLLYIVVTLSISKTNMAEAEPVKLNYVNMLHGNHIQSRLAWEWCREVERRTNKRVIVEYFSGEKIPNKLKLAIRFKAGEIYGSVVRGELDIGMATFALTGDRFPVMGAVDLPIGYTSGGVATDVVNRVYHKFVPRELNETKVMYLHAEGPFILHTKSKPVKKLADVKGMKLRGYGISASVIKELGATLVSVPMPALYNSIKKNMVEGGIYPMEMNKSWYMGDVIKYTTTCFSIACTRTWFVVMNKEKWNMIPSDARKVIERINKYWAKRHGDGWDSCDMEGYCYCQMVGNHICELDKNEAATWKRAIGSVTDQYVGELEERGINGREIVEFMAKTLEGYKD
jgi:TRAP-type C4-dicarboxylate transport system substrate-binding protein